MKKIGLKKILIYIFLLLVIVFISYIGIKLLLFKINTNKEEGDYADLISSLIYSEEDYYDISSGLNIANYQNITFKESNDYLTFENVKIRNDFENYKFVNTYKDDNIKEITYGEDVNGVSFSIGILKGNINSYSAFSNFFEEKGITTDVGYIEYIKNYEYKQTNIFSNYENFKNNTIVYYGAETYFNTLGDNITLIKGDYDGLIGEPTSNGVIIAYLYKDNQTYAFTFYKTLNLDKNDIIDLISTIIIE